MSTADHGKPASGQSALVNWVVTLTVNVVLPFATYVLLTRVLGSSEVTALLVSGVWPVLEIGYTMAKQRVVDEFSVFVLIGIVIGVVTALFSDDARAVFLKDSIANGLIGVVMRNPWCWSTPSSPSSSSRVWSRPPSSSDGGRRRPQPAAATTSRRRPPRPQGRRTAWSRPVDQSRRGGRPHHGATVAAGRPDRQHQHWRSTGPAVARRAGRERVRPEPNSAARPIASRRFARIRRR